MASNATSCLIRSQPTDTDQPKPLADGPRASLDRLEGVLTRRLFSGLQENVPTEQSVSCSEPASEQSFAPASSPKGCGKPPVLSSGLLAAVVKVNAYICRPNYDLPWQMRKEYISTSTAFAIPGRRLLTVSHGLLFHSVVRVKKRSSDVFFIARVLCIAQECDLALLAVDDDAFWDGVPSLSIGDLPALQESVTTVGYPVSGDNICLTSGVTSRIELRDGFLIIQIDAAINPGNSGGPALAPEGRVVGVAFQKNNDNDNTGFFVASNVVRHFLADYDQHGRYTGLCTCGFHWQTLPALDIRRYLKMGDTDNGVLVLSIPKKSPAYGILEQDDVVLSVDGQAISNTGTIPHASGERLCFQYLISTKFAGQRLDLEILRKGKRMNVNYNVQWTNDNAIVKKFSGLKNPEYYIIGGLVFVALSEPYLSYCYGNDWKTLPHNLIELLGEEYDEDKVEQFVILSKVINDEVNVDYCNIFDQRLTELNGIEVKSLAHLHDLIMKSEEEFLRFDLDFEIVVLDRLKAMKANKAIQERHYIPQLSRLYIGEENGDSEQVEDETTTENGVDNDVKVESGKENCHESSETVGEKSNKRAVEKEVMNPKNLQNEEKLSKIIDVGKEKDGDGKKQKKSS